MSIVRKARRLRFTQLDNALIEDQEIGFPALGVLAYLLSKPDHWTVSCGDLQRRGGIGRDALRSIMGQLQAAGYASLATAHGDGTRVAGTRWEVSEDKAPRGGFSDGRNPRRSESPTVGKPAPLVKTDFVVKTEPLVKTDDSDGYRRRRRGAPPPASPPPSAARDGDDGSDDALTVAYVQAMTGRAGNDLATYSPATTRDARAALVTILPSWPDLEPDDVRACAEAWTERLRRIRHGGPVDPPTARQLAEALAAWSPERTEAARPVRWMVPAVER